MTPLLPLPVDDEHALSLLNAYLKLNEYQLSIHFGYSYGIYRNSEQNLRFANIAGLFSEFMSVDDFLDLHCFVRFKMYQPIKTSRCQTQVQLLASASVLRFCPECRRNDVAEFGYARWRRSHQLSGISVCPDHGCMLLQKCSNCDYEPGKTDCLESSRLDCPHCGTEYAAAYPERASGMRLVAQFYQAILDGQISALAIVHLPNVLKELAQAKYGASEHGIAARLRRQVEQAFPQWFLAYLEFDPRNGDGAGWIRYFCAGLKFTDCLHAHALIGAVVFASIQEWVDVYAEVGRQHLVHRPVRVYHQIPLPAQLLRDLAWKSSFVEISRTYHVTKNDLHWVIAHVPGLQQVRNTSLFRETVAA